MASSSLPKWDIFLLQKTGNKKPMGHNDTVLQMEVRTPPKVRTPRINRREARTHDGLGVLLPQLVSERRLQTTKVRKRRLQTTKVREWRLQTTKVREWCLQATKVSKHSYLARA